MIPGIFLGYHLHSGGLWSGDQLVQDAEAYQKRIEGASIPVHRMKDIHLGTTLRFPVQDGSIKSLPEEAQEAQGQPEGKC